MTPIKNIKPSMRITGELYSNMIRAIGIFRFHSLRTINRPIKSLRITTTK